MPNRIHHLTDKKAAFKWIALIIYHNHIFRPPVFFKAEPTNFKTPANKEAS